MPLTVRDLVGDPELGLTPYGVPEGTQGPISWVHTSELADPTPFLEGGELLLTTGLTLGGSAWEEYVERLVGAGVAGLGFGVDVSHSGMPPELVEAASRQGLPLLAVPRRTPFIAISKAVSRALAADEYEDLRRTSRAQHELAGAAVGRRGLSGVVHKLASLLDGWALLLDEADTVLHSAPGGAGISVRELEPWLRRLRQGRGRGALVLELGEQWIGIQELGTRGGATLVVGRDSPFGTPDHHVINSAASLVTLALRQAETLWSARGRLHTAFLRTLLSGAPAWAALDDLGAEFPAWPVRVLVLHGSHSAEESLRLIEAESDGEEVYAAEYEGDVVALAPASANLPDRLGKRRDVRLGVSEPCGQDGLPTALRQARQAVAAASDGGGAVWFTELAGRGLLELLPAERAVGFAESLLWPLRGRDELLVSLRGWLAHNGQWDPAAKRLGLHRHTLRNRIRRTESLLGRDLDQAGVRAELWLALQLLDDAG
ncbi:helix-turn-helix domain-containing protein [Actinopolyspora mortivallis]|uniref:helix-turn-helix domain-containing protein n=1 Tax=Actinopolyspora mortivallis TaxID=33906 RepID=UPI00215948F3|nr:PucR family transcriptional regulator [Actinopolyspora mortivallis]